MDQDWQILLLVTGDRQLAEEWELVLLAQGLSPSLGRTAAGFALSVPREELAAALDEQAEHDAQMIGLVLGGNQRRNQRRRLRHRRRGVSLPSLSARGAFRGRAVPAR